MFVFLLEVVFSVVFMCPCSEGIPPTPASLHCRVENIRLGIGEMEDDGIAKDTKDNAAAFFDAVIETPGSKAKREQEDKKIRMVGAVGVKSTADEQREALQEALLPAGRYAEKGDLARAEQGIGSPEENVRKSSAVIDAWMFGDGTE